MTRAFILLFGMASIGILKAGDAKVSLMLDLQPLISQEINIDSTILILFDADHHPVQSAKAQDEKIIYEFDSLEAGEYSLTVQLYYNDVIIAENSTGGHLDVLETKNVSAYLVFSCAYPILHMDWDTGNWNNVNNFYNYSINPDSNFLKRVQLENLDSLSSAFRASGVRYYRRYTVNWGLLDSNMVPIVPYSFGDFRNPVTTCHTVFAFYEDYIEYEDSLYLQGLINNADWLVENCDSNYYLHYEFQFSHNGTVLPKGWVTGMAQGLALAALSIAYDVTGESKYLDAAHGVFRTMYENMGPYYCFGIDKEDYYWLEEYPSEKFCHVLNGKVSGLWGFWCYYTITGDEFARILLEAGIKTIVDNYPIWNVPDQNNSYYCLHNGTNVHYHSAHLVQLRYFGDYFNVRELNQGADCFANEYFRALPLDIHFSKNEDTSEVLVFSPLNWTASTEADWLTIKKNENKLSVTCDENFTHNSRTANIIFSGSDTNQLQVMAIVQDSGKFCILDEYDTLHVSYSADELWIKVHFDTNWTVSANEEWIEFNKLNDTIIVIEYHENLYHKIRRADLRLEASDSSWKKYIHIVQDPGEPSLIITPESIHVSSDSGTMEVRVIANDTWNLIYDTAWLQATAITDSSIMVHWMNNPDYLQSRTGFITICLRDSLIVKQIKIDQKSVPLYLNVYADSLTVAGDTGSFSIRIEALVNWDFSTSDPWLVGYHPNDTVLFVRYEANSTYENRNATIMVILNDTLSKEIEIIQLASTVGMDVIPGTAEIEIYPNPAYSKIIIRMNTLETVSFGVEIFNLYGEKIGSKRILNHYGLVELDVSSYPSGIYFLRITNSDKTFIQSVIIE